MPDLIDRDRLLKYIDNMGVKDCISNPVIETANTMQSLFKQVVEAMPKADTERHAHWIKTYNVITNEFVFECSNCGHEIGNVDDKQLVNIKYCWNCGCKMNNGQVVAEED